MNQPLSHQPASLSRPVTDSSRLRHLSSAVFLTIALAPLGAAISGCLIRPDALAPLTLVPPWFWVLLGFPSIIWAVRIRQRCWYLGLIAVWLCFSIGWVEEVTSLSRSARNWMQNSPLPNGSIRIVSLNCANTASCLADLQDSQPDIALLQEPPGNDDLKAMARKLYGDEGSVLLGHDTAIIARGTIEPLRFERPGPLVSGLVTLPGHRPLQCISLRRSPPVPRLDFWTAGFWTDHRNLRVRHRAEIGQVRDALNDVDSPLERVVGGDFNSTPLDPTLDELTPTVRDAFLLEGSGLGGTGTNNVPLFRVDQIWLSVSPIRCYSQRTRSSDHRMVICDLPSGE